MEKADSKISIPENIDQIIIKMIREMRPDLDLSTLNKASNIQQIKLHEVDFIELIIDLEELYDIDIDDTQIMEAQSIDEIIKYLKSC